MTEFYAGLKLYEWTFIQKIPDSKSLNPIMRGRWRVECSCGQRQTLPKWYLTRPEPKKHCGCKNKGLPTLFKHEYSCWYMMHRRCEDPKHVAYKYYGGRGIKVHPNWSGEEGFANFLADLGPAPTPKHTIDRFPDNDGTTGYVKGNVRWATPQQQRENQRPRGTTGTT